MIFTVITNYQKRTYIGRHDPCTLVQAANPNPAELHKCPVCIRHCESIDTCTKQLSEKLQMIQTGPVQQMIP